jgi:hypothetical protein
MLTCFFFFLLHVKCMHKINKRLKSLLYLVFHANNQLFYFKKKKKKNCFSLFSQVIKNYLTYKVLSNLSTCQYDKQKNVPKKPMSSSLI